MYISFWSGNVGQVTGPYAIAECGGCGVKAFVVHGDWTGVAEGVDVDLAVAGWAVEVVFVAGAEDGTGDPYAC